MLASIFLGSTKETFPLPLMLINSPWFFLVESEILKSREAPQNSVTISSEPSKSTPFIFTASLNLSDVPEASYSWPWVKMYFLSLI